mgnify:FL=1|jgi:hypothetical protein
MNALPQEKGGSISQLMNKRQDKVDKKIRPGFKLYGENRSDGTTYERDAMKSIQHDTPLNQMFFSAKNIENLQCMIRYGVYLQSNKKYTIDNQSESELYVIMRSIFLQHSRNLETNIQEQIRDLNKLVVLEVVPKILSELQMHYTYMRDISANPIPLSHPVNESSAGTKKLRSVTSLF